MQTYFINPIWFWVADVSHTLGLICAWVSGFLGVGAILVAVNNTVDCCWTDKNWRKLFSRLMIGTIISLLITSFAPSKETCTEMMVASLITKENVETTIEVAKDTVDYIIEKVEERK